MSLAAIGLKLRFVSSEWFIVIKVDRLHQGLDGLTCWSAPDAAFREDQLLANVMQLRRCFSMTCCKAERSAYGVGHSHRAISPECCLRRGEDEGSAWSALCLTVTIAYVSDTIRWISRTLSFRLARTGDRVKHSHPTAALGTVDPWRASNIGCWAVKVLLVPRLEMGFGRLDAALCDDSLLSRLKKVQPPFGHSRLCGGRRSRRYSLFNGCPIDVWRSRRPAFLSS